jgi:hypothetical protein
MRRDIGNEIIVAIAAIGMLAIAIVFAIILSLSRNAENTTTPTIPSGTSIVAVKTAVETLIPSAPQNADTPTPSEPAATDTEVPASSTPMPQATDTPMPTTEQAATAQHVTKPSATVTKIEATDTVSAPTASATKQATQQPTVPTDTPTKTVVPTTAAPAASNTPQPSATQTMSPVPLTLTFTATPRPSDTAQPPTNTSLPPSATFTASAAPPSKTPQPTQTNTPIPASVTAQSSATITPTRDGLTPEGCTDSGVQISNLTPGQKVKGMLTLIGTAYNPNFLYYKIETRPNFSQFYTLYSRYERVVIQNELGTIDTAIFSPGLYWIKLTVVNKDNTIAEPCAIPVNIQR